MFYKVIKDNEIIDVLDNITFVKIQIVHNRLIVCPEKFAQGILSSNGANVWFVNGLIEENINEYQTVELIEVDETEYNILKDALSSNESIEIPEEPEEQPEENEPTEDELNTLEFVRESKIAEMNNACNTMITQGFNVVLSDGESHHFDFSVDDQLNMMSLKELLAAGETSIPYHASNEACKFYSVEDIQIILNAGTNLKTYHVTYFNALKQYIKSLRSINTISKVFYGIDIPEKYQSEVLVALLNSSNNEGNK